MFKTWQYGRLLWMTHIPGIVSQFAMKARYTDASTPSLGDIVRDDIVQLVQAGSEPRAHYNADNLVIHPIYYEEDSDIVHQLLVKPVEILKSQRAAARDRPADSTTAEQPSVQAEILDSQPRSPHVSTVIHEENQLSTVADTATSSRAEPNTDTRTISHWEAEDENQLVAQPLILSEQEQSRLEKRLATLANNDLELLSKLPTIRRRFVNRTVSIHTLHLSTVEGEELHRISGQFQTTLQDIPSTGGYRILYRGAAPHAYYATHFIIKWAEQEKKQAKKQFKDSIQGADQRQTNGEYGLFVCYLKR
jgi:hypothetical protein